MLNSTEICHQQGAHMAVLDSQEKENALQNYIERMYMYSMLPTKTVLMLTATLSNSVNCNIK